MHISSVYLDELSMHNFSERLIKSQAQRIAKDGYKGIGYSYVIIDDCWLAEERDSNGRLQPDPTRFPSGMKALSDYVSGKPFKIIFLGLWTDDFFRFTHLV